MKEIIDNFHQLYYNSLVWDKDTLWRGIPCKKCPLDLWVYQEIIYEIKPYAIIETGTGDGGTTLFLANICDLLQQGKVISIDILEKERPAHRRIEYILGSSISGEVFSKVRDLVLYPPVVVILDSDHYRDYVLTELRMYSQLVTVGSYLIVEDSNLSGHPIGESDGLGPREAVEIFLKEDDYFELDRSREKFMMTFNPSGYLRRIK